MGEHKLDKSKKRKNPFERTQLGSRFFKYTPVPASQRREKRSKKDKRGFGEQLDHIQVIPYEKTVEVNIPEVQMVPNKNGHLNPRIAYDKNGNIKRHTFKFKHLASKVIKHFVKQND